MQTDLEESKGQEIIKLQNSLQALQSKLDETNALLVKEREAAQNSIEEAPSVIKETPVVVQDTEKIDSHRAEVERLKVVQQKLLKLPAMAVYLSSFPKNVVIIFTSEVFQTYCISNINCNLSP